MGESITLTTINPTELNVEPIRADAVMLLQSRGIILHTEFQTIGDETMPFRMADYYLRLQRKFPETDIQQVVIYLKRTSSDLVRQDRYVTSVMTHQFRVIRLWEQPVEIFLSRQGLLPLAILSQEADKASVLAQVAGELEQITDLTKRRNLSAATSILAGLELEAQTIQQLMRSPVMRESTMYQAILSEGRAEGIEQGLIQGRTVGERAIVIKQLTRKLGSLSPEVTAKVSVLSLERLEALAEALLDFTSVGDLESWLG